jgi:hypothetical protein
MEKTIFTCIETGKIFSIPFFKNQLAKKAEIYMEAL